MTKDEVLLLFLFSNKIMLKNLLGFDRMHKKTKHLFIYF